MNNRYVWRTLAVMVATSITAGTALAESLDLNLNDDAARLTFAAGLAEERLEFDLGWLHHQDRGNVLTASIGRIGEAGGGEQSITAGLGARLFVVDPDLQPRPQLINFDTSQRGVLLGVGGFFRFKMANYDRIGFAGHGYYAPDVLAFADATDLVEIKGRITYSIIRDADVYLGVRYLRAGFDGQDVTLDNGLHLGLRLEF